MPHAHAVKEATLEVSIARTLEGPSDIGGCMGERHMVGTKTGDRALTIHFHEVDVLLSYPAVPCFDERKSLCWFQGREEIPLGVPLKGESFWPRQSMRGVDAHPIAGETMPSPDIRNLILPFECVCESAETTGKLPTVRTGVGDPGVPHGIPTIIDQNETQTDPFPLEFLHLPEYAPRVDAAIKSIPCTPAEMIEWFGV